MNEYTIGWQASISGLGAVIGATLYWIGGRNNKAIRRILGSFILALTVNGICLWREIWSPFFLIVFPLLFAGFSLGYGADGTFHKITKRTSYALACCMSGLVFCFVLGGNTWFVLIPHIGIALWSIYLGVKNPISAAAEEFFICMLLNIGLIMYPFIIL